MDVKALKILLVETVEFVDKCSKNGLSVIVLSVFVCPVYALTSFGTELPNLA